MTDFNKVVKVGGGKSRNLLDQDEAVERVNLKIQVVV